MLNILTHSENRNMNLSVIIPTLNNKEGLKYLLNYFKNTQYDVVIVDNKPNEEKKKIVMNYGLGVRWIKYLSQKRNLGFAIAVNRGAKNIKTKWMLILNDDIEFESQKSKVKSQNYNLKVKSYQSNILKELVKEAERKKLDAVSPVLRNPNGKVENYGYKVLPYGKVELVRELTGSRVNPTSPRLRGASELDGLTAACLLVKTKVFRELKGFDEKFFAYLEDVDFFLRFKKVGYKLGLATNVEVLHNHMTTTKTMGNFKAKQDMVNWWRLYFKHRGKFKLDFKFIIERLRNVSGFIKASLR